MKTTHIPNCWICGRAVSLGNSRIDENHLAVHESCYVARMALEKGQSQPSTVAKEGQSQRSTRAKAEYLSLGQQEDPGTGGANVQTRYLSGLLEHAQPPDSNGSGILIS